MSKKLANELKALSGGSADNYYLSESQKLASDVSFSPQGYTVTDFENDAAVQAAFDKVTDYLSDYRGVGSALLDQATIGEQDDVVEFLRDDVARLGAPLSKAAAMKNAPEDVKAAYRLMQDRFNASSLTGVKEHAGAIIDYGADVIFNPETIGLVASLFAAPATGGTSVAAGAAAKKTAQQGAKLALKNALKATAAAKSNNPMKSAAAIGSIYGGAGMHVAQELDIAIGQKDEYSVAQTAAGVGIGSLFGVGLYKAGNALSNKYFRDGTTPAKPRKPEEDAADFDDVKQLELFDTDVDEKILKSLGGPRLADDAPEGTQGKLFDDVDDVDTPTGPRLEDDAPEGTQGKLFDVDNLDGNEELNKTVNKFVADVGGGEKTREEILEGIRAAADSETTVSGVNNRIKQVLYTVASDLSGNFYGKAAGVLSPIVKLSGTAAQLQKKLSHEFGIEGDIRKPFKPQEKVVEKDLSEVQREVTGKFNDRFRAIVEDISLHAAKGTLAEDMNKALMLSIRSTKPIYHDQFDAATNKAIRRAAKGVKGLYNDMGVSLKKIGVIDELVDNYVPRMWSRNAIEKNQEGLIQLLRTKANMSLGEARRTVDSMLDVKNQVDAGGTGGYFFSAKRKLNDIANDADFQEFLNEDVLGSLSAYTFQAGKAIAKHRVLGVNNFEQFKSFYINRIRKELTDKGETFSTKQEKQLEMLYRTATGEGLERFGKTAQNAVDAYGFVNRVAMLGLATVSSLTEVFLNISKAGVRNSVKGLGEAMEFSFKNLTKDLETKLVTNNNLTVKEAMSEMRQFSIHIDQAMAQLGDRLSGDALVNERLQNASNKFFRLNMLDQWTKFVQATSFSAGKHLINEDISKLAANGSRELSGRMRQRAGRLAELGIDYEKAVKWYNAGGKTDDAFYKDEILGGVARYTNSVILQPTAMSGLKPLLHSHPKTQILFQLMGYPVAFTNTVLKGAAKTLIKDPTGAAGKIIPAGLIMTGMARWTNYLRTNGESEKGKDTDEILTEAIARWGGNGILIDSYQRAKKSAMYTKSTMPYLTMPLGPAASDALGVIQQGIIPVVGKKVPVFSGTYLGKQILGDEEVTHYRKSLHNAQKEVFGGMIPDFERGVSLPGYVAGGLIKIGAKAVTDAVQDITGNTIGTLPSKLAAKQPDAFSDEMTENLSKATDNYFTDEALSGTTDKITRSIDELEAEGRIDGFDLDSLEFVDAVAFNEIRKDIKPIDELEKIPSWKKATESSSTDEAVKNWAKAQEDMGFTKEHRKALNIISESKNEIDPEEEIDFLISDVVQGLRNMYKEVNIEVTADEVAKATKMKFKDDNLSNLHDFISMSSRLRMDALSEFGGDKVAENVIIKLIADDVDLSTFKAPKISDVAGKVADEKVLVGEARSKAIAKYVDKSAEKDVFFRAETSFTDSDFFLAFAFSREVGVHTGSEGAATTIAIRGLPNTKAKQDLKLASDARELTRESAGEAFGNPALLQKEEAVLSDTTRVVDDIPLDEPGYFGVIDDVEEITNIKPITMNAGYIDVRNPLFIDSDLPGWEAERILSPGGGWDEFFLPEIQRRGVKITNKQQKKLDDLMKRSEQFEGLFLDPPVGQAEDIVGFYKQELARTVINKEFRELLEDMGFDSIRYRNEVEQGFQSDDIYSYILFKPEQFKSVTARAFDASDARHMAAEGGYIIKKGDTLSKIAREMKTTVKELAKLNNIEDVNKIYAGQKLDLGKTDFAAQAKSVKAAEPIKEIEKNKPKIVASSPAPSVEKTERPMSSRERTVNALRRNISKNPSSSRTRTEVQEQKGGGLFSSQVFKNLATYINPFGGDKTEADYSPEVIEQLKIAARNSLADGRTNIDYADYSKESNVRAQVGIPQQRTRDRLLNRAFRGELTPTEEAAFSVGGAQIKTEGDDVFVTDVYDFAKLTDEERTSKERDRYSYLRDFMAKLPGNEFRSKIKIGTKQDFGL